MTCIKQPDNSNLCGQCCVAMLLNITIEEAIGLVGKKGKTGLKDLAPAIRIGGYLVGKTTRKSINTLDAGVMLMKVKWHDGRGHWILKEEGLIFDPSIGTPVPYGSYVTRINGKIVSHTPLTKIKS